MGTRHGLTSLIVKRFSSVCVALAICIDGNGKNEMSRGDITRSNLPVESDVVQDIVPDRNDRIQENQEGQEQSVPGQSETGYSQDHNALKYYLDLTWHLVQRDFTLRYKGSALGVLWVLVVPLMQLLTLVFVFKNVIPLNIDSYPAFVFTALLPWTWFSNCLNSAGALFISNRDLIRRPNFPPLDR